MFPVHHLSMLQTFPVNKKLKLETKKKEIEVQEPYYICKHVVFVLS